MKGSEFLAALITSGRLFGIGIGSTLGEVDRAVPHHFVDETGEDNSWLRRDYGLLEFSFNPGKEWIVASVSVQLHRLAPGGLAREWARSAEVDFPRYQSWEEVTQELSRTPGAPGMKVAAEQPGFLEYQVIGAEGRPQVVSVLVVDDEEEERGYRVGHGDVWSIDLWAPFAGG